MFRHPLTICIVLTLVAATCKRPVDTPSPAPDGSDHLAATPASVSSEAQAVRQLIANFERVHFPVDSSTLDPAATAALDENAKILQEHFGIRVEVQGHADDRGTVDYNLALGQRRADSVARRLSHMGVKPGRVATISFGEERPLAPGSSETAWSANRRAEFRVITGSGVSGTVED